MEPKVLADCLSRFAECERDGERYRVPDSYELTLFANAGEETLVIDKVREVLFENAVLVAFSSRSERFVLLCQDVRCLRITGGSKNAAGYT